MATIAFTGHRPNKLSGYKLPNPTYTYVCQQLEKTLLELKPDKAISGMALGVDQWAAHICVKLGIPFIAAVPCDNQDSRWPEASKKTYQLLLKKAAEIVVVSPGAYTHECMQKRNEWMVHHCDKLIGVWDGSSGGTMNCINFARGIGREII